MTRGSSTESVLPEAATEVKTLHASCSADHSEQLLAIADAMDVLNGKWKIQLIGILLFKGKQRFGELLKNVEGIGTKMLSKELQNLEANRIVTRTVLQTKPVTVEYEITPYGRSLEQVIFSIGDWGLKHREKIMGKQISLIDHTGS